MKQRVLVLLCALVLLTGCAGEKTAPEAAGAYTFTDDLGRTVTLDAPERVAALTGSFADLWCLAGGKDVLVAAAGDAWTSFDLGLSEDVIDLGAIKQPDLERLLSCASVPVMLKPNAGLPRSENGRTVYDVAPAEFAAEVASLVEAGVAVCGGCCKSGCSGKKDEE